MAKGTRNGGGKFTKIAPKKRAAKKGTSKLNKKPHVPQGRGKSTAEASAEPAKVLASYGGKPHKQAAKKVQLNRGKKGAKNAK
jgi:hypothetical protein